MLPKNARLSHVALAVNNLDACQKFYNLLGMQTELKTPDYIYLTNRGDNLSLHKVSHTFIEHQRLEHIGFVRHEVTLQTIVRLQLQRREMVTIVCFLLSDSNAIATLIGNGMRAPWFFL